MAGMYPDNQTVSLFGEKLSWPGMDGKSGKFTNGSFADPLEKPSFIPAETLNLILDNLSNLITALGKTPNNSGANQLKDAVAAALALKANLASPEFTGTPKVPAKSSAAGNNNTLIATEAQVHQKANVSHRHGIDEVDQLRGWVDGKANLNSPVFSGTPKIGDNPVAVVANTSNANDTNLPIGSYICVSNCHVPRNSTIVPRLHGNFDYEYETSGWGAALTGTWRTCGRSDSSNYRLTLCRRVA